MTNRICPHCGQPIRLLGLAAICPHCGQLVTAPPQQTTTVSEPELPVLPELEEESEFVATPLSEQALHPVPERSFNSLYIALAVAGALVVVLATVLALVLLRPGTPAAVPPASPAPTPRATTEPKGSDWFSETPQPPTQTAQAPPPITPEPTPAPVAPAPASKPVGPYNALVHLQPQPQPIAGRGVTDDQIGAALQHGVDFLLSQFNQTRLRGADNVDPSTYGGLDALAVYALLHAGQAIGDPRINAQSKLIGDLLDRLKEMPMSGNRATYSHSLRVSALAVLHRAQDRAAIETDMKWLVAAAIKGGYDYDAPPPPRPRDYSGPTDNSNSQYGALGVWAASSVGLHAPPVYWSDVEQHWSTSQALSGGWGYHAGDGATLSMTAAGTTMLFVSRDQMSIESPPAQSYIPLTKAQEHALEWLDDGDNAVNINNGHRGYTLYGLERAGLASGYKYFGKHDWYQELAQQTVTAQDKDGSWGGGDGTVAETAFNLLFLARGRHPVFMSKLKFDGAWGNRPRDLEVLTRFASDQLERPLNWQVADITHDWWAWSDSAVVYISSDRAVKFSDDELAKLRAFAQAGGLIFCNAERDSAAFNASIDELAAKLFPEYPSAALEQTHPIFSMVYPMTDPSPLRGVSNGSRLLLVHSTADLARWWQPFPPKSQRQASELAINIGIYATGRRDLHNRLASSYVPEATQTPIGTVPVARLSYQGNWDPEPAAWVRCGRLFQAASGIALDVRPTPISELKFETTPMAALTGTAAFTLNDSDVDALRVFVTRGGTLLIDACGGGKPFGDFVRNKLLPAIFPDAALDALTSAAPILAGAGNGMHDLRKPKYRPLVEDTPPPILQVRGGAGVIYFSRLDLTSGLLGSNTAGIAGYQSDWCQGFIENAVLWTLPRLDHK